jgi:hypothetical protein
MTLNLIKQIVVAALDWAQGLHTCGYCFWNSSSDSAYVPVDTASGTRHPTLPSGFPFRRRLH